MCQGDAFAHAVCMFTRSRRLPHDVSGSILFINYFLLDTKTLYSLVNSRLILNIEFLGSRPWDAGSYLRRRILVGDGKI